MIHEVDDALRELVRAEALGGGAGVDVVFDAPTRDWAARRNTPTVNLYLYDIREDLGLRSRGRRNVYDEQGRVISRTLPPRYFKLSYLISAWTQRPEDEHRLLASLLGCFLRYSALPGERLGAELGLTGLPVPVSIALPPPENKAFTDVWSALGGELKPSLDVVVSAPVVAAPVYPAGPPVEEGLSVDLSDLSKPVPPPSGVPAPAPPPGAAAVPRPRAARARRRSEG
ncbi:DUF4255 domain-containing protein [Streptomyces sp. ISL-43]|uniref:DUF4255 domain-containing protein n=1 Tax=Streptomyces sp. ISL-43 TaxID=2819183 RepID=UPI001BE6F62E|nr:DUF4255 domain-containing protein [Streptomyces sp. ISL-43]MBT2448958.1 DUF4255 domain-containing protein [Streptomyces sp. ISL-43]